MLITDVDGTLVDRNQQIPPENLAALTRFRMAGGLVTLGTGRIETSAKPLAAKLQVNAPAVLYNGGRVVDLGSGQVWFDSLISNQAFHILVDLLESDFVTVLNPILYSFGRPYVRTHNAVIAEYSHKDRLVCEPVGDLHGLLGQPLNKVLLIGDGPDLERMDRRISTAVPTGLVSTVRSEPTYLEILPYGASKGAALRWLAGELHISPSEIIAVGDSLNDMEMVQFAGLGVAVANAHPDLKRVADFVSPFTNEQAAVADLIERFCLR